MGILLLTTCGGPRATTFVDSPVLAPAAAETAPTPVFPEEVELEPDEEQAPAVDDAFAILTTV